MSCELRVQDSCNCQTFEHRRVSHEAPILGRRGQTPGVRTGVGLKPYQLQTLLRTLLADRDPEGSLALPPAFHPSRARLASYLSGRDSSAPETKSRATPMLNPQRTVEPHG